VERIAYPKSAGGIRDCYPDFKRRAFSVFMNARDCWDSYPVQCETKRRLAAPPLHIRMELSTRTGEASPYLEVKAAPIYSCDVFYDCYEICTRYKFSPPLGPLLIGL
jgi:hypothetical protein